MEGQHNRLNHVLLAFAAAYPQSWPIWLKACQWAMRATPQKNRGGYSPFEIVCGLKPQGPLSELWTKLDSAHMVTSNQYVMGLRDNLKGIHDQVASWLEEQHEARVRENQRDAGLAGVKPGDYVFFEAASKLWTKQKKVSVIAYDLEHVQQCMLFTAWLRTRVAYWRNATQERPSLGSRRRWP